MKITVTNVKKINAYHLKLTTCIPSRDNFKNYYFDYTGTDLESNQIILEDEQQAHFKDQLYEDYGPSPFNTFRFHDSLKNKGYIV